MHLALFSFFPPLIFLHAVPAKGCGTTLNAYLLEQVASLDSSSALRDGEWPGDT